MLKALKNTKIEATEELKDFLESLTKGLAVTEVLNLSVDEMIEIYNLNFSTVEEFACYYANMNSSIDLYSCLEMEINKKFGPTLKIKDSFKLNKIDEIKIGLFLDLLRSGVCIEDVQDIIKDIDKTLFKYTKYIQIEKQFKLYQLGLMYGESINLQIRSIINLYNVL